MIFLLLRSGTSRPRLVAYSGQLYIPSASEAGLRQCQGSTHTAWHHHISNRFREKASSRPARARALYCRAMALFANLPAGSLPVLHALRAPGPASAAEEVRGGEGCWHSFGSTPAVRVCEED